MGALFNMIHVLDKAKGMFLVYSTDQDFIDYKAITPFKKFLLENPNIAGGFCDFDPERSTEAKIFPSGYKAILNIAYKSKHPTGYFFKNDKLKSINLVAKFSDYLIVDLFPLDFAFGELLNTGLGAIYYQKIFTPNTGKSISTQKSLTTNGKHKTAFFAPESRLKLLTNYARHILTLDLSEFEKDKLIEHTYLDSFFAATRGYRTVLQDENLCSHYYMTPKKITIAELVGIGKTFHIKFLTDFKRISNKSRTQLFHFQLSLLCLLTVRVVKALQRRLLRILVRQNGKNTQHA
jgi:hypothetical protein